MLYFNLLEIFLYMCCSSKKKPVEPVAVPPAGSNSPVNNTQTSRLPANNAVNQSRIPKSTISFNAQDYDSAPLNNQSAFVATQKVTHYVHDRGDRMEDYATEVNTANKSHMILENKILNYDLDAEDGVSKTPIINTFHYESTLNHCFLREGVQASNIRNSLNSSAYHMQVNGSQQNGRNSAYDNQIMKPTLTQSHYEK